MCSSASRVGVQGSWIQEILKSEQATGILIMHLPHVRWACGFTGSNGFLLVKEERLHLFTDRRYETQATLEVHGAQIHIGSDNLVDLVRNEGLVLATDRLLIQPQCMTVADLYRWEAAFPGISLIPRKNLLNRSVAVKSEEAIAKMRQAQSISDAVFHDIIPHITLGIREIELAALIDYEHRLRGASGMAFETIVAFGANSALPHARPGNRALGTDEPVLLDFGCSFDGYTSDMTRTLHCGEPPSTEFRAVYEAVQEAQERAVSVTHTGMDASAVDHAARSNLVTAGLGDFFSHSTGHGIGLEVHEWPRISANSSAILEKGQTITIEPGVYLPGRFGVRIEDTVLIGASACERLSHIERDLIIV